MKNVEKVLKLIQQHPAGLDDDEIADRARIQPRQQVYQICKRLEVEGKIHRAPTEKPGKRRKIHNFPTNNDTAVPVSAAPTNDRPWSKRLAALQAATGREANDLLTEAVQDLALKILRAQA